MAYVDEGQGDAIVFAHGNPTSSYLWRNVMPHLEGMGRLVAADMIGMGGSAKLNESGPDRYSYAEQRDYLFGLWDSLDLGNKVVLVVHDWGSAVGFDWARQHPDRVQGIAFMESIVANTTPADFPEEFRQTLAKLRGPDGEQMVLDQNVFIEGVLPQLTMRQLSDEEMGHYREPYERPGEDRRPMASVGAGRPAGGRACRRDRDRGRVRPVAGDERGSEAVHQPGAWHADE
jgi:haloalkane dehalogenase